MSNDSSKIPWNSWWGVIFVVLVYAISQIMSGIAVSLYPVIGNRSAAEAAAWLADSVSAQFFYVLLAEVLAIGALYVFLKHYRRGFASIGLRRPRWSDLGYGLAAVPVYFLLYALVVVVVAQLVPGLDVDQKQQLGFDNVAGSWQLTLTFISLVVLPPVTEEIMFRGFLYTSLKKALPVIWAVVFTSALFAIAHLPGGGEAGPLYIAAVDTFVLSLVLIYLREKSGGLWAPITLHAAKNGIAFVALFVLHVG